MSRVNSSAKNVSRSGLPARGSPHVSGFGVAGSRRHDASCVMRNGVGVWVDFAPVTNAAVQKREEKKKEKKKQSDLRLEIN